MRIGINVTSGATPTMPRPFLETSPGYLERAFHFNVTTAFALSKAALRRVKTRAA